MDEIIITGVERHDIGWRGVGYVEREGFRLNVVLPLKNDQEWGQVINELNNGRPCKLQRQLNWQDMTSIHLRVGEPVQSHEPLAAFIPRN
jgi:hypothetical protein